MFVGVEQIDLGTTISGQMIDVIQCLKIVEFPILRKIGAASSASVATAIQRSNSPRKSLGSGSSTFSSAFPNGNGISGFWPAGTISSASKHSPIWYGSTGGDALWREAKGLGLGGVGAGCPKGLPGFGVCPRGGRAGPPDLLPKALVGLAAGGDGSCAGGAAGLLANGLGAAPNGLLFRK